VPTHGTFQLRGGGEKRIQGFFFKAKDAVRFEETYAQFFKLADNSVVVFNGPEWVEIGNAIEAEVVARFVRGEVLMGRIAAATTPAALDAITWTLEDPE